MLILLGAVAFLATTAQEPLSTAPDPCAGQVNCRQATAAQLFALADQLFAEGDYPGAERVLEALTGDPHPELRAEARFRLAAVRQKRGNLEGAIAALHALLVEQPNANPVRLELSRLLAAQGRFAEARRELGRAQEAGLPADVAHVVDRFARILSATKRRGGSVQITAGADSNVNRSTSSQFIDTVIAPFELSPEAQKQAGFGISADAQCYSRDEIGKFVLLSRGGVHGDFFVEKSRFNDVQLDAGTGPEFATKAGRIRPALTLERRWFGGNLYSSGIGGVLSWVLPAKPNSELEIGASMVRQTVHTNHLQSGTRFAASVTWDRLLSPNTTARFNLRAAVLDARARPESLHQATIEAIAARELRGGVLFVSFGYTKAHGLAPIALFGKTRGDDRIDVGGGIIARWKWSGFAPVARVAYTRSWSNIALYDYSRIRLDIGVTREF